jgi:uncharacterized membrane protein YgcG
VPKLFSPCVAIAVGAAAVIVPMAVYTGPTALDVFSGAAATTVSSLRTPAPDIRTMGQVGGTGGVAVVFDRPSGAFGFGHVGFGFYDPNSGEWTYGAVENPSGSPDVAPGQSNGAWSQTGSFADMASQMAALGYTDAVSMEVADPDMAAALGNVASQPGEGYSLFGNNCADAVWNALSDYGAALPYLQLNPTPNGWFQQLSDDPDNQPFGVGAALADPSLNPAATYPGGYVDDPSQTGGSANNGQVAYNGDNGDNSGDDGGGDGGGGDGGGGGSCGDNLMALITPAPAATTAAKRTVRLADDADC